MPTVNDELRDKQIKQSINNLRFRNGLIKQILTVTLEEDIRLEKQLLSISNDTKIKSKSKKLINKSQAKLFNTINGILKFNYRELVKSERDFEDKAIKTSLPIKVKTKLPTIDYIIKVSEQKPFMNKTMKQMVDGWDKNRIQILNNTVTQGILEGRTNQQITKDLFGTKNLNYKDGKINVSRNEMNTIVRTTTNHLLNETKTTFYKANQDIIKGQQWVSTLDSRTTLICVNLDGKVDYFDGSLNELNGQVPPVHWGERSVINPITKSWEEMGIDENEIPETTRASMDGQVSAKLTYPEWLNKQSATFQKDLLGPERYGAWKDGKVKISQFTDNKNNVLTLDQLKKKGIEINGK